MAAPVMDHVVSKLLEARLRPMTGMVTGWVQMVQALAQSKSYMPSNTQNCSLKPVASPRGAASMHA